MTDCNAWQCRRSRSPRYNCRCSCGGENHGVDAGVAPQPVPDRPPASTATRDGYQAPALGYDIEPRASWPGRVCIKEMLRSWCINDHPGGRCLAVGLFSAVAAESVLLGLGYKQASCWWEKPDTPYPADVADLYVSPNQEQKRLF